VGWDYRTAHTWSVWTTRPPLRWGKVKRLRKILTSGLVVSKEGHAIGSVLISSVIVGKTKNRIRVLIAALLSEFCLQRHSPYNFMSVFYLSGVLRV